MHNSGMIYKDRLLSAMKAARISQAQLAKKTGITSSAVNQWFSKPGEKITLKHENLQKVSGALKCSVEYLEGRSNTPNPVRNMYLVRTEPGPDDVLVPQYNQSMAAGRGNAVAEEYLPHDYITFKKSWVARKGLVAENLAVVPVEGDSMEDRIVSGDIILIDRSQKTIVSGKIYAFSFDGLARVKKLIVRANGNISIISTNDPDGSLREDLMPETFEQLHLIGRAIWVGGDLP